MAEFSLLTPMRLYWTGKGSVTGSVKGSVIPSERMMSRVPDVLGPADATASCRASCRSAWPSVGFSWSSACRSGWRCPTAAGDHVGARAHGDQGHPGMRPEPVDQRPGIGDGDGEPARGHVGRLHGLGIVDDHNRLAGQGLGRDQRRPQERPDDEDGRQRLQGQEPRRP